MRNNVITLEFDKTLSCLAGNPYGESVFDNQVKNKIDYTRKTTIIFPQHIDDIATSFIQGFFKNIVSQVGTGGFQDKIEIQVSNEDLYEKILDNIVGM